MTRILIRSSFILLCCLFTACTVSGASPSLTPTRALGPTLEPSPTVLLRTSDELQGDAGAGQNDPTAAALPSGGALPPVMGTPQPGSDVQTVQIPMADGALLPGDLYEYVAMQDANDGTNRQIARRVPGVLLLGADRAAWGDFPARLQASGLTALVMQTRQPGTADDFSRMLQALSELGTVNPGSIGVIGVENGADFALVGCAADLLCDVVVLLSPMRRDPLLSAISRYSPRPLFMSASQSDAESFPVVEALQEAAVGEVEVHPYENIGRGAAMLHNSPELDALVIQWLQRQLVG